MSEGTEVNASAPAAAPNAAGGLAGNGSMVPRGAESITGEGPNAEDESEEAMLRKAISLSQAGEASNSNDEDIDMTSAEPSTGRRALVAGQGDGEEDEEMDEDEAIARAIQMSLQEGDGHEESRDRATRTCRRGRTAATQTCGCRYPDRACCVRRQEGGTARANC